MVNLVRWKPIDRLMSDFFDDFSPFMRHHKNFPVLSEDTDFMPKLDLKNNEKEFEISIELPGMNKKDIDISIDDGVLTIKGEKKAEHKEEDKDGFVHYERSYGSFQRAIRLPENIAEDKIKADYKDGVLTLTAPKAELKKPDVKKIELK